MASVSRGHELEAGTYIVREVEMPSSRYSLVGISNEGMVVVAADETAEVIITNRYRAPAPAPDPEPPQEPEEPIGPEEPVEPEEPVKPEEPTDPEQPLEPEEPTKPEDQVERVEPATIEPADPGTLPKTSAIDSSQYVTHDRDWGVIESKGKPELTLTTCLFSTSSKRLIVKADLVGW